MTTSMKKVLIAIAFLGFSSHNITTQAQDKLYSDEFPLGDIELLDSPLKKARDLNIETLLKYDCDRMLAPYRKEAGLEPRKPTYPNWDGLDGHVGGHYLSALAINAATGNEECRRRMEYMLEELNLCAEANDKRNEPWAATMWEDSPTAPNCGRHSVKAISVLISAHGLHSIICTKCLPGLRDTWLYCDNATGHRLFLKFCDWAVDITSGLTDEQMERMLGNEHGGMDEVIADAYAMTGDKKYLDCARRFAHRQLLIPMEEHRDCLDNMHANTQIPKVVGFQRISELDGDNKMHDASQYFWDIVTSERSLALGGNSRREHFPTKETCIDYVNDIDGPESCNTYNMLKLYRISQQSKSRRSLRRLLRDCNVQSHSLDPASGAWRLCLLHIGPSASLSQLLRSPTWPCGCCVGTGMENHGKYGQFVWTRSKGAKSSDDALYLNLFVASQLNWRDKGMVLRQETAFPMPNHRR